MNPVEQYLVALRDIRASSAAVDELSFYGPLADLLNEIGKALKPKVHGIMNLRNRGAGLPDGGLFTAEQFQGKSAAEPLPGQLPARGAIEAKGTGEDLERVVGSTQVARYVAEYGQVLVTNLRGFALVGRDASGRPVTLETYRLAESEPAFWAAVAHPHKLAAAQSERLVEYLKRVLLHAAPLAAPQDLAWFLASYARDARARVEGADLPALTAVRAALEEALGIQFEGAKGDHFFRSTLVQTLFYGLFAAWVLWHKERPEREDPFDWRLAAYYLRVPVLGALYEQVSTPTRLRPLELTEVLDWAAAALNRVEREEFFSRFEELQAVQYFYEPFLQAFDPELRKELGVWYTPPEIVQYMVARVDTVLRTELGIADGLADRRVYVLDPCCGTGAYLVEVLRRIAATLKEQGADALLGAELKRAARERVFGFELLPAPFVIAHLQLGLLLGSLGAGLSQAAGERVGVYLTNALTGWEPPGPAKERVAQLHLEAMPQLKEERDAAREVKREREILVVLGNPPYNAFAGVSPVEEQGLVEPYKEGLISQWGIKKFNLDDLYVRFFRLAERRIAEMTRRGVVCFISNHSWVSDPSFVVLRQHLLSSFDRFWIENMHGNRKISEYAPDGHTSETIFAIPGFSPGIQQGVAISLWVKSGNKREPQVLFRDDLTAAKAAERRAQLLASLSDPDFDAHYQAASPEKSNRYSFRPSEVTSGYLEWPKLVELCAEAPSNGLMEKRGGALIDIDRAALEKRMRLYYDPAVDWEALRALGTGLTEDAAGFEAKKVRPKVQAAEQYQPSRVRRYALRPFDTRWCYYSDVSPLWNRSRPTLWAQCWEGNQFLLTRFKAASDKEGIPYFYTMNLSDDHFLAPDAIAIPLRLKSTGRVGPQAPMLDLSGLAVDHAPTANLSPATRAYLTGLGITGPDAEAVEMEGRSVERPYELIWMHALSIGYCPAYLAENADGIRQDWPRIPLPASLEALLASAALGRQVAALLDTEAPLPGVTTGAIREELRPIAVISHAGGGNLNPDAGDLALTAGWGHAGKEGVTMPGKGKVLERPATPAEYGSPQPDALKGEAATGGAMTLDVYLNDVAYWRNIPPRVWEYTIGGYQVIKKWLSYRELALLGRSLTLDEVREVTHMARRIAALVLLEPALDANYQVVKAATYAWPG